MKELISIAFLKKTQEEEDRCTNTDSTPTVCYIVCYDFVAIESHSFLQVTNSHEFRHN